MEILINDTIYGFKSTNDLIGISELVSTLNENATIVDLGSSLGNVTWHLAKNAPSGSVVYALDVWDDTSLEPRVKEWCRNYFKGARCSIDKFLEYTKDCNNIIPIKTYTPPEKWDYGMVDMVVIDIDHNPNYPYISVKENIDFWMQYLKPNGIMCGYNWAPNYIENAEELKPHYRIPVKEGARKYNKQIHNIENTWWWVYK